MSIPHNNMGPPLTGPPPPPNNGPPLVVRPNGPAPRSMEELCQPSIDGRGGPIASIPIQATDFGLRHHIIQQVQNTFQFHGLPGDDANRHIDKFLEITQHMKQIRVSDNALRLSHFPYSLTHHAIAWYDRFPRNFIHSFDDMMRKFLSKYFPPSMDTSATRDETSRNISSTTSTESLEVVRQLELMNKNFVEMMRQIQLVKSVNPKCETCGGPHSFIECPAADGYTQEAAYATTGNYISGGNSYQLQGDRNLLSYRLNNYLEPPGFNQPNVQNNQNRYNQNQNQGNFQASNFQAPNNQGRGQDFDQGNNNYQAPNLKALNFQAPNYQAQVGPSNSNTIANPRGDVEAITTRSGVAYNGPTIPPTPPSKEVERETEVTKDKQFLLPELTTTRMTLELADRSTVHPKGVAEDVFVKVRKFYFPADFVVVDYDVDPRVPLILGRPFLRTSRALIDVYGEELTLRVDDEAITFKVGQTSRDSRSYEMINQVNVIDVACEEYAQEVLGFSDSSSSGNPTPSVTSKL
ncbi:reverse transcriptase domain-containing protein [Tanacetum coccineum]